MDTKDTPTIRTARSRVVSVRVLPSRYTVHAALVLDGRDARVVVGSVSVTGATFTAYTVSGAPHGIYASKAAAGRALAREWCAARERAWQPATA